MLISVTDYWVTILSKTRTHNDVSSETSEPTSKQKFVLGLKNGLTFGEIVSPYRVV